MCIRYIMDEGRYEIWSRRDLMWRRIEREAAEAILEAFPGKPGPIIIRSPEGPAQETIGQWGLIPPWAKDPNYGRKNAYNARCETIAEKPTFRSAFRSRRCLVPASGFFDRQGGRWKRFERPDQAVFAMAGIWEPSSSLVEVPTYAVVTCEPNGVVAPIQDRMPVILAEEDYETWMAPDASTQDLLGLMVPCPEDWLTMDDAGPIRPARKPKPDEPTLF